ncbi:uncharacterized protein MYCFIDRAFT_93876, partial [Pseudocercospora fijiensis CIRAD86]
MGRLPPEEVRLTLHYDGMCITATHATWLLNHVSAVLSRVSKEEEGQRVEELFHPSTAEVDSIHDAIYRPAIAAPTGACIHDLIFSHAQRDPNRIAVAAWDGELTYAQLCRLARTLAQHLAWRGIGRGCKVPLCFDRSSAVIVAMLGVLTSGASLVLLDPAHPDSRLRAIVHRIGATLALVSEAHRARFSDDCNSLVVDRAFLDALAESGQLAEPASSVTATDLAYILFTSGSTGEPKGVLMEHGAYVSSAQQYGRALHLDHHTRALHAASYAFGAALGETVLVLLCGGCVVVPHEEDRAVHRLGAVMRRQHVSWTAQTPSVAHAAGLQPSQVPSLKTLVLAGEPLTPQLRDAWADSVTLLYAYGQSETASICSVAHVRRESDVRDLGHASGARIWLVDPRSSDDELRLVPRGCLGELVVESTGVCRGYLANTDHARAAALPVPAWAAARRRAHVNGRRLAPKSLFYRTGDMGRYAEESMSILYCGRLDDQIKIRGQRIELREVELVVAELFPSGSVRVLADVVRRDADADADTDAAVVHLTVFLVTDNTDDTDNTDNAARAHHPDSHHAPISLATDAGDEPYVRSHVRPELARRVPYYMLPSLWLRIPSIPKTAAGKLDRKTLRRLGVEFLHQQAARSHTSTAMYELPSTPAQRTLQRLWAQVLPHSAHAIGADADFFHLSGDSVRAMKLRALARDHQLRLSMEDIFRRPKLRDMAEALCLLPPESKSLHIKPFALLGDGGDKVVDEEDFSARAALACGIADDEVEDVYPCTPLQAGMMALSLASSHSGYVTQYVLELKKAIDVDRWLDAWEETIRSLAILRTRIVALRHGEREQMVQVVTRVDKSVSIVSASDDLDSFLAEHRRSLGLGQPLARIAHVSIGPQSYFVWTSHHALYDSWSLRLILRTVSQRYLHLSPPETLPFNSFIGHLVHSSRKDAGWEDFWRKYLDGAEDCPFPPHLPSTSESNTHLQNSLERFCSLDASRSDSTPGITRATIIYAALAIVLGSYAASQDIVFGATVSGRAAPLFGIEQVAGPTIATIPVRVRLDGKDQKVTDFLYDLHRQTTATMPFEQAGLQNISGLSPSAERACAFRTHLSILPEEDPIMQMRSFGELRSEYLTDPTNYPLLVQCELQEGGILTRIKFDASLLPHDVVDHFLGAFTLVLQQLAQTTDTQKVGDIELTDAQHPESVWQWNENVPTACHTLVHELIFEQARIHYATSPAICAWDGELTYGELDVLSDQLARCISRLAIDVGHECVVPLCFEKSMWMPVAMLGVMKAGAVSLALDVTQPQGRLQTITSQVRRRLFLCSNSTAHLANELASWANDGRSDQQASVLVVDEVLKEKSVNHADALPVASRGVKPENALYMVFTSGSTGVPKGVVITHMNFSTALVVQKDRLGLKRHSRVLDFSSYAFDMAWHNLLHTLYAGACFCIPSESERINDLSGSVHRYKATFANLTPKVADVLDTSALNALEALEVGGELATVGQAERWRKHTRVRWFYGPAECSAISSISADNVPPSNIGPGGVGLCTWIVDPYSPTRLCPMYAVGELVLEGPLVARGYYNDPERTAESFIDSPQWLMQRGRRSRVYRTGDLVKYDLSGDLIFLGRRDGQVKIRGQRVELGDVEHHVTGVLRDESGFPDAQVAAEMVTPKDSRNSILVAFVARPNNIALEETRAHLVKVAASISRRLSHMIPPHMIPSGYIVLSDIPLSSTGKTHRQQLREIGARMKAMEIVGTAESCMPSKQGRPLSATEALLRTQWADVLGRDVEDVGIDDTWFQLGGDSIAAMRLVASCMSKGIPMQVQEVFRRLTIANLAAWLQEKQKNLGPKQSRMKSFQIRKDTVNEPFDLSPMQRLYLSFNPTADVRFHQYINCRLARPITREQLDGALLVLTERHAMLRARLRDRDYHTTTPVRSADRFYQIITDDSSSSYHVEHHQLPISESEIDEEKVIAAIQTRLNVTQGPLLVAALLDVGHTQRLWLTCHHLFVDYISWGSILEDLEVLLTANNPKLPALVSVSYQQWCKAQQEYAHAHLDSSAQALLPFQLRARECTYWAPEAAPNAISTQNTWENSAFADFLLDPAPTMALLGRSCNDALDTRPVELLVAALIHSFATIFPDRAQPLTIHNEGHGREPFLDGLDVAKTVGWFTTLCPIQIDGTASQSILDVVARVKDCFRSIPSNGWAFFTSRMLNDKRPPEVEEVVFNNAIGALQPTGARRKEAFLQPLDHDLKHPWAAFASERRFALFDIVTRMRGERLQVLFAHSTRIKHQDRIARWILAYKHSLIELATVLPTLSRTFTLTDFPLAFKNYADLSVFETTILPALGLSVDEVEDIYPCAPVQKGILLSQSTRPELYRVHYEIELRPAVDVAQLQDAWHQVIRRHAILRTLIVADMPGSGFAQIVLKSFEPQLGVSSAPDDSCGKKQRPRPEHELIIEHADGTCMAVSLKINHALIDAHSYNVLLQDLQQAYTGLASPTPPASTFKDYVKYVESQPLDDAREYWKERLSNVEPCNFPSLDGDGPRSENTKILQVETPPIDHAKLQRFCERYNVTVSSICQAAWALVLCAYTGNNESACFSVASSGREHPIPDIDRIVGPLIVAQPCIFQLQQPEELTLLQLVRSAQAEHLRSMTRNLLPLAEILHSASITTIPFNTGISVTTGPQGSAQGYGKGLSIRTLKGHDPTDFDLTVHITVTRTSTSISLMYRSSLLHPSLASSVAGSLCAVLESILSSPNAKISDVESIGSEDLQKVWNWNSDAPPKHERLLHDLVAEQVNLRPNALAIEAWDGKLTYRELEHLSNSLALQLQELGIKPESLVPLLFEHSVWVVVAMLGGLKAGGAFVPLHPDRLVATLDQIQPTVILTSPQYAETPEFESYKVLIVGPETIQPLPTNLTTSSSSSPENAAYTIFTSGSTGSPKGVIIPHSAICTSILSHGPVMSFTPTSRVLQFASYTFDASIQEIFTTLVFGGCICIPASNSDLDTVIQEYQITWAVLAPSLSKTLKPETVGGLKTLVLCGEKVTKNALQDWTGLENVMVGYGPTECSIVCVTGRGTIEDLERKSLIGKAVGCHTWIVHPDNLSKLVPIGAVGELVVEGEGLARGYLNDTDKTRTSFFEDLGWLEKRRKGRVYRTGDLVRWGFDGRLEFLGRRDEQVKVHGQRVELGDVEVQLQGFLADGKGRGRGRDVVVEAAQLAGRDSSTLVAFVEIGGGGGGGGREGDGDGDGVCDLLLDTAHQDSLKEFSQRADEHLHRHLPAYMCPKLYLPITHIPLTISGKINRRLLRHMASTLSQDQLTHLFRGTGSDEKKRIIPPQTDSERILRDLWARVLAIPAEKISTDDAFFRLGGDSLSAIKLASTSRDSGLILSVRDVFLHPILSALATNVLPVHPSPSPENSLSPFTLRPPTLTPETTKSLAASACGVPVETIQNVFPCTPLQAGMVALSLRFPGEYVVCYALELNAEISEGRWRRAWEESVRAIPSLRTRIAQIGEGGLFQIVVDAALSWEEIDSSSLEGYISREKGRGMGLGAPLARFALLKTQTPEELEERRVFVLTIHHGVFDGWSLPLILEVVASCYRGSSVLPRTVGHDSFVQFLAHTPESEAREFWRGYFEGLDFSTFPTISKDPQGSVQPGEVQDFCVFEGTGSLSSITVATLVKAAWALVVGRNTASHDIVFGCTVSGRNVPLPGIERVAGPTVATVPLRVRLPDDAMRIEDFLSTLQRDGATMMPYEQTGLVKIATYSAEAQTACTFQTLLIIQPDDAQEKMQMRPFGRWVPDHGAASSRTYPLVLKIQLAEDRVKILATFDPRAMREEDARRLLRQLVLVLSQLRNAGPETTFQRIVSTPLEDERRIRECNAQAPASVDACVHHLIADQARARPNAVAVCSWDGTLTYGQLHAASERFARRLCRLSPCSKAVVALCFQKSKWTSIAALAVMKAGGASVALDTALPAGRLRTIVDQVRPPYILCSEATEPLARMVGGGYAIVRIDRDGNDQEPLPPPLPTPSPADPLYVVFTSGSTGVPKGVIITHSNFATAAALQHRKLHLDTTSRVLDGVSYAFDVAWSNMLHCWLAGACLCIPNTDELGNDMVSAITRLSVTYAHLTPSLARMLDPRRVPSLRVLSFIGEPLNAADLARWKGTGVTLLNTYGPAECTVVSTITDPLPTDMEDDPSIGSAVGLNAWIVEPTHGQYLVPIGAIGELVLEGPLVGAGYLHDADKTRAVFLEYPEWLGRSSRLYRTGDLVRSSPEDPRILTFVGRKDGQVKIRGQRVELGEVEHHVEMAVRKTLAFQDVRVAAALITPRDMVERSVLAAFLVWSGAEGEGLSSSNQVLKAEATQAVNDHLAQQVPSSMIPVAYIRVESIPLEATGKVSRRRLKEIGSQVSVCEDTADEKAPEEAAQPSTALERELQAIFARTLKRSAESIGVRSDFFQMGGDSITAIQVVAACRARGFGEGVSVQDVFQRRNIAELAVLLEERCKATQDDARVVEEMPGRGRGHDVNDDRRRFRLSLDDDASVELKKKLGHMGLDVSQVEEVYACAPTQEAMLLQQAVAPDMYRLRLEFDVLPSSAELPAVNVVRLQRAWRTVVKRHAILRTVFVESERGFVQVVLRNCSPDVVCVRASPPPPPSNASPPTHAPAQPQHRVEIRQSADASTPVKFILSINHALMDAHSIGLLVRELTAIYSALPLDHDVVVPYAKFIEFLAHQSLAEARSYWASRLQGVEACCIASTASASSSSSSSTVAIPPIAHAPLKLFCATFGVSVSSICQVAWALVLRAFTASRTPCFGVVISGRELPIDGVQSIVGPLVTTVPFVVPLDDDSLVLETVRRSFDDTLHAVRHQLLPLMEMQHTNTGALFDSALSVTTEHAHDTDVDADADDADDADVVFRSVGGHDVSEFAIAAHVVAGHESTRASLNYASTIPDDLALSIAAAFSEAISSLTAITLDAHSALIGNVNLVSAHDVDMIRQWNAITPQPAHPPQCLHERVSECAAKWPEALAVCSWDAELTYHELDQRSTRLAHSLVHRGVGADVRLPFCIEKSAAAVVAILAILKAGATFVPLDPQWPAARYKDILARTDAPFVLTSRQCQHHLVANGAPTVLLDESPHSPRLPLPQCDPNAAAYVLFTSGSTGAPKGVVVEHSAVCTSCLALGPALCFNRESRVLQFSAFVFDGCLMEIFTTLLYGGCVCVPSDAERANDLEAFMNRRRVNYAFLTPSRTRLLNFSRLQSPLETLLVGGEPVANADCDVWSREVNRLLIVYGPTEACIICFVAHYPSPSEREKGKKAVQGTIGRAILPSSRSWIVDATNFTRLCPIGATGELLIEGPVLARAYLGDEAATNASFVHALQNTLGAETRLYRTGDLVKYERDGTVTFVGRMDGQVKVNGQRIEVGEIEQHVRQCLPNAAVVVEHVHVRGRSSALLAAFIQVGEADTELVAIRRDQITSFARELPQQLRARLPIAMVPKLYIPVTKVPLTVNGKVDRRSLRHLLSALAEEDLADLHGIDRDHALHQRPSGATEQLLSNLWAKVLGCEERLLSRHDHFLQLGGDSLTALKLSSEARKHHLSLAVSDILRHPILSDMAHAAGSVTEEHAEPSYISPFALLPAGASKAQMQRLASIACELSSESIEDVYPCTPLQEGMLALSTSSQGDYLACYVLALRDTIDLERFKMAWHATIHSIPILRTRIAQLGHLGLFQIVQDRMELNWTESTSLQEYVRHKKATPPGLGQRLLDVAIVVEEKRRFFVWTIHHALFDGWSLPLILDVVEDHYGNGRNLRPMAAFNAFIAHLCRVQDEDAAAEFWRSLLAGFDSSHFPSQVPNMLTTNDDGGRGNAERFCSLGSIAKSDFTISSVLRAAWALVVARYTASRDIVFGCTVYGRSAPVADINHILGPTIATVPVRVQVNDNASISEFLRQIQNQTTAMIQYEQVGLRKVRSLGADAEHACQFQTLLVIQPKAERISHDAHSDDDDSPFGNWQYQGQAQILTYPLMLQCEPTADGVRLSAAYDRRVLSSSDTDGLLDSLAHVLTQLVEGSLSTIDDIEVVTPGQLDRIWSWNAPVPTSCEQCVHDLVLSRGDTAPAIDAWDGQLSYAQLDDVSSRLASRLQTLDLTYERLDSLSNRVASRLHQHLDISDTYVPICLEKSLWAPVAMLAVLKSGRAFVPLDPKLPPARCESILQQVRATCILTSSTCARRLLSLPTSITTILVDREEKETVSDGVSATLTSSSPAYIIFTSGSTGQPKGVVMEHGAVSTSCLAHGNALGFATPGRRVLQFSSYVFDGCIMEIFTTLIFGGCICIPSESDRGDYDCLATFLREKGVNWAFLTPSVARCLSFGQLSGLDVLVVGGEVVTESDRQIWRKLKRFMVVYGPTEACVICMRADYADGKHDRASIGRAIEQGWRSWVVNSGDRLLPIGAVGELLIEGPPLARGYLGAEDKTQAAFIESPDWLPNARLYRTGDLVRYTNDGGLNFVGRRDEQVKINGQRLELAEIELQLAECLALAEAVIVELVELRGQAPAVLVAFVQHTVVAAEGVVTLDETRIPTMASMMGELEVQLRDRLPTYMLPKLYVPLTRIPLTTSGKADRRLLRQLGSDLTAQQISLLRSHPHRTPPSTRTERLLADLWAQVLKIDDEAEISIHDDFFQSGGDSISVMKFVGLARGKGLYLDVRDVFANPTIHLLSPIVEN